MLLNDFEQHFGQRKIEELGSSEAQVQQKEPRFRWVCNPKIAVQSARYSCSQHPTAQGPGRGTGRGTEAAKETQKATPGTWHPHPPAKSRRHVQEAAEKKSDASNLALTLQALPYCEQLRVDMNKFAGEFEFLNRVIL